ncbi:MAG: hypothetical protein KA758_13005 [Acidimicrobiales bacterium]|nr:hypothetical protein [Acidimicrobiales bacterium]
MAELLANTLNLASAGQTALDAICDMTPLVPVDRLVHGHALLAVAHVQAHPSTTFEFAVKDTPPGHRPACSGDDRQRRAPIIGQWSALLDGALNRSP